MANLNVGVPRLWGRVFQGVVTSFASGYAITGIPEITGNAWAGTLVQTLTNAVGRI